MKMAKASEADMDMAMKLNAALESFGRSDFPSGLRPDRNESTIDPNWFDLNNGKHCREAMAYLLELAHSASLGRVVFGMATLLDPRNKLVDPNSDTLEHYPVDKA